MVKKAFCLSSKEADRFVKKGYVIVAISQITPDGKFSYHLEKGSKWSQLSSRK